MTSVLISTASGGTESLYSTVVISAVVTSVPPVLITSVRFYLDDVLAATVTSAPYEYSWDTTTVPNGSYQWRVSAKYSPRKVTESKLDVSVSNSAPDPLPDPPVQITPVLMEIEE